MYTKYIMTNKIKVSKEIDPLRKVVVHRPDAGISRISPRRAEELLFDDIVHLPLMQKEHDVFTDILKRFLGTENVLEVQELIEEGLKNAGSIKEELIDLLVIYEELPSSYKEMMMEMKPEKLAETLITGYHPEKKLFLFDPIPNFIFTRDIAVTINEHIVITKAAKEARARENLLTRFFLRTYPEFQHLYEEGKLINLNIIDDFPPSPKGEVVSIEGGDIMIINEDYLLVGCSERTTAYAVKSLAKVLFEKGAIKNVAQINIPNDRAFMHIDTLFTQISENDFVAYKPVMVDGLGSTVEIMSHDGSHKQYLSMSDFIKAEINPDVRFILAGNGVSPYQEREQWTDGCNLVALKPGVGLTYDRNPHTEIAFKEAGYKVVYALDLLKAFDDGILTPDEVENTIITLPSNELSRARGGSHCMTFPLIRN